MKRLFDYFAAIALTTAIGILLTFSLAYDIIGKNISPQLWQVLSSLLIIFWALVGFLIEHFKQKRDKSTL
ncbi:MAG: hypothetical protein ACD_19C00317G0001 [uncultured bacterium]|uniref:Uncharacterized protein n=1 Tax=Candidatus Woesebacteria bacterium RIFCSPLOWO2_01_FULL_39_21 TaxID=1802519 RepID=A0A1F8BPC7_9BACT|nr:MAG: hypothetical protein ACD_19C00317G0001 [uncultured bacterium]OGM22384.1 MAG: hypothetical protein A2691_02075 [Candidatus Woesebacteria bacterium RIFCSPHIGHO2_01_FULL_39_23]OGM65215.1 MAG: hypothetical protein A2961_00780 [Candidatus Woesebacteria bacterium RIFCSPLOWO2_01_FULL_39_21]